MNKKDRQEFQQMIAEGVSGVAHQTVTGCTFTGVHYDAKAADAIQTIAEGLVENAKALGALAQVLKASNVAIETLLRVEVPKE